MSSIVYSKIFILVLCISSCFVTSAMDINNQMERCPFSRDHRRTFREIFDDPLEQQRAVSERRNPLVVKAVVSGLFCAGGGVIAAHKLISCLTENNWQIADLLQTGTIIISCSLGAVHAVQSYRKAMRITKENVFDKQREELGFWGYLDIKWK